MKTTLITLLAASALLASGSAASAGVLRVPGDHATIQAAVDAAAPGDTIKISSGTYSGFTVTTDELTIKAEDGATPVIQFFGFKAVGVTIDADRVTIEGLSAFGGGAPFGIAFRVTGTDNTFRGNDTATFLGPGFESLSSSGTVFDGNICQALSSSAPPPRGFTALNCSDEVYTNNRVEDGTVGFQQMACTDQVYKQNSAIDCSVGFETDSSSGPSSGTIYRGNVSMGGGTGFYQQGLVGGSIRENTVMNGFAGVWLDGCTQTDVRENLVTGCVPGSGFNLDGGSDQNDLRGNQSTGNAGFGYRVVDLLDNTFVDNQADGNGMGDSNMPGIVD